MKNNNEKLNEELVNSLRVEDVIANGHDNVTVLRSTINDKNKSESKKNFESIQILKIWRDIKKQDQDGKKKFTNFLYGLIALIVVFVCALIMLMALGYADLSDTKFTLIMSFFGAITGILIYMAKNMFPESKEDEILKVIDNTINKKSSG